jgi:hypothetical protein
MGDRPEWDQWILQKNAEHESEELKKSDSVTLEKAKMPHVSDKEMDERAKNIKERPPKPLKGLDAKGRMVGAVGVRDPESGGLGRKEKPRKKLGPQHVLPPIDPEDHPRVISRDGAVGKADEDPAPRVTTCDSCKKKLTEDDLAGSGGSYDNKTKKFTCDECGG